MDAILAGPDPRLVWGLFTRGLGLVFLVSFVSLSRQVATIAGSQGGLPVSRLLARMQEDFPSWRRFYYFPSLLWLSSSDRMLRGLTYTGIAAALLVIIGGPWSTLALATCYVCYVSLDVAMALIFPWDCLLFECTLLGLFLPGTHLLPELASVAAPAPALTWGYRLLLFRLMFGFGKQKFIGSRSKDLAYLKGFLVNQPLPSTVGWYGQKVPVALLKGAVLFMFVAEIPGPFMGLIPGPLSIVCALLTIGLMVGIQLMGSFGYFSLATIVLCIPLFDNVTPRALEITRLFSAGQPVFTNLYVLVHTFCAGAAILFNSWLGQSWHLWAFWYQLPRWVQPFVSFVRFMHPFRWLHPYGVFPPNTTPAVKMTLLVEVSWDKQSWHELEFHYSPSNPQSPPRFVAPHHPRGDQAVIYDTFGLNPTSLISSVLGSWSPYPFASRAPAVSFCQCVLRGRTLGFVRGDVLDHFPEPPRAIRMTTQMLEPVSIEEHRSTGNWWKRTYVGPHVPPQELDPEFFEDALAEPELWHFDAIFWRRRSRLRPLMERALKGHDDPLTLSLYDAQGITREDVQRFWSEFVPRIAAVRGSFDTLSDVAPEIRARYDRRQHRALYRLLGRFALILVARLEPHYLYKGLKPEIPVRTYFHLWMLAHHIIGCGREAYLAAYDNPLSVASYIPDLTTETGLYAQSVFRLEEMTFEAQKLRLIDSFIYPHDPALKRANADKMRSDQLDDLPKVEQTIVRVGRNVSGFFNIMLDLRDNFKGPRFDQGYPELYPTYEELESGEVVLRAYAEPPAIAPGGANSLPAE
ncbi:MAG TPA: lipase maturation factor family protein [Polyangiaceae bacterium]|nr:lipase maturation factor family protein [Polyangiaceae bacterium]